MKILPQLITLALLAAGMLTGAPVVHAQGKAKANREQVNASGVIKAMQPGLMQVVTDEGEEWLVKLESRARVKYYADAEPGWLKPGMLIQFSSQFDAKGVAQEPLRVLTVVTPRPDLQPGVKVEQGIAAADGLFEREDPNAAPKPKLIGADVVGKLASIKDGELKVLTPGARVAATLAPKAVVAVEFNTLQLAKIGDSVEFRGWYPKGFKGRALSNQVTVRAKESLKAWKKPLPAKRPASKGSQSGGKPASDPLNGPADPLNGPS